MFASAAASYPSHAKINGARYPLATVVTTTDTTFTCSFVSSSMPQTCSTVPLDAVRFVLPSAQIFCVALSNQVACRVAPKSESKTEPKSPVIAPKRITCGCAVDVNTLATKYSTPTKAPPSADAANPKSDTPPFVPGGTLFSVVINLGLLLLSTPSSDAHVSAAQHA